MKKNPLPRHGNVRLSLECKEPVKQAIIDHGVELGEWSMISVIRRAVERSKALYDLEERGTLLLLRHEDDELEDVEIPR